MNVPHAVIIAGGQGQRLGGVRKADLRIGGLRLIDRVARTLTETARPLLVAVGANPGEWRLPIGSVAVTDLPGRGGGPLAGLTAAVAALRREGVTGGTLISVAVDTPFLPHDFTDRMTAGLGEAPAVFATYGEDFYPPNAAWRIEALGDLLLGPLYPQSLRALHEQLGSSRVDWAQPGGQNPFANVNTIADLIALGRRTRG